jgi:hypothetical protein
MTAGPRRLLIIDTDSDVLEMLREIATELVTRYIPFGTGHWC